jgi:uncharacterized membrane-anchored protein
MSTTRKLLLSLAILALAQTGVLGYMVADRVTLLRTGRTITLPIIPVDPRDLFRGEYVRLGYAVGTVPMRQLEGPRPDDNAAFYVELEKQAGGDWRSIRMSRAMPRETPPDRIVLKARARHGWPLSYTEGSTIQVRYGIESYFVPEGQGPRLEALARDKKMAALIAVDSRGNAAIKGLVIDGALQYEEPLF